MSRLGLVLETAEAGGQWLPAARDLFVRTAFLYLTRRRGAFAAREHAEDLGADMFAAFLAANGSPGALGSWLNNGGRWADTAARTLDAIYTPRSAGRRAERADPVALDLAAVMTDPAAACDIADELEAIAKKLRGQAAFAFFKPVASRPVMKPKRKRRVSKRRGVRRGPRDVRGQIFFSFFNTP